MTAPSLSANHDGDPEKKLKNLPAPARAAYQRFKDSGDEVALDEVIMAILADFAPKGKAGLLTGAPGTSRLIEDLGFDSLAITEVVFFTEDLFGISIGNQELIQIRTLDELRQFVRKKVGERPAA